MSGDWTVLTTNPPSLVPEHCAIAFKEWAGVCDALVTGRQSLILRKGGVAEALGEFRPDHAAFWLYPTVVHQAEQGLRTPTPDRLTALDPRAVSIEALAVVEWLGRVDGLDQLDALAPFHDWTEATIRGRFNYRRAGLWAMVVRVYHRRDPWSIAVTPEQLGCKTWVPLDPPVATDGVQQVLENSVLDQRLAAIRQAMENAA